MILIVWLWKALYVMEELIGLNILHPVCAPLWIPSLAMKQLAMSIYDLTRQMDRIKSKSIW